jgi:hypothetical protein
MKLRFLPLLWIVCVPLVRVGALPHPGLAAAVLRVAAAGPEAARGVLSPWPAPSAVPPMLRTGTAIKAGHKRDLALVIMQLPFVGGEDVSRGVITMASGGCPAGG